jgi:uncharacterized protein (TIGR03083 family)
MFGVIVIYRFAHRMPGPSADRPRSGREAGYLWGLSMFAHDVLVALRAETEALSAVLRTLDPPQFDRPTNCPPWNLRELVVHTAASVGIRAAFPPADPQSVPTSAADYYRRPERNTSEYRQRNVDQTRQLSRQQLPAETSPARWFDEVTQDAVTKLSLDDLNRIVLIPQRGAMRLADWVLTRVISVAAHGLDAALTLGHPPWTTSEAATVIRPVFVELMGAEPPASLGWDDHTLLATATGRRALTAEEQKLLGPLRDRIPVLS